MTLTILRLFEEQEQYETEIYNSVMQHSPASLRGRFSSAMFPLAEAMIQLNDELIKRKHRRRPVQLDPIQRSEYEHELLAGTTPFRYPYNFFGVDMIAELDIRYGDLEDRLSAIYNQFEAEITHLVDEQDNEHNTQPGN